MARGLPRGESHAFTAATSIADGLNGTERVVLSAGAFLNPGQKVDPVLKNLKR